MKIGFDCDGVLSNFLRAFTQEAHKIYPHLKVLTDGDGQGWGLDWYTTDDELSMIWSQVCNVDNFWAHCLPLIDLSFFKTLVYDDTYIITSRIKTLGLSPQKQTQRWLYGQNVLSYHSPQVIMSDNKHEVVKALGLDYYIDDKPEIIKNILNSNSYTQPFLLRKPWSKDINLPNVYSVGEFLYVIGSGLVE